MHLCRSLVLASALVLAGCAADSSMSRGCTDIGCVDGVSIDFGALTSRYPQSPLNIHVCLDTACQDAVVGPGSCEQAPARGADSPALVLLCLPVASGGVGITAEVTGGISGGGSKTVAVSITDGTGAVVYEHTEVVPLGSSRPNGDMCEPVCHEGKLTLSS